MKTVKEKYEYLLELVQHQSWMDGKPYQYKHYQGSVCHDIDSDSILRWIEACDKFEVLPSAKRLRMIIANRIYKELKHDRK